ncbi:alcohol dehydrogenase [Erwinia sp. OLTSP20]|uniref:c-type cytochrome n=1 Tax=unclassified Erwinia TaxID=2622719 RepID=UPI000C17E7BB|nr:MULTISPECIES: cytochrome c [unclassified Erwinia]PIJ50314.1 alcohol dehydrogenase [Erwinia sp. OAMSP11]PIJ72152.1 alcohol dehydrogenase [Erwinia sp. OLSSP12]PIJ81443.1 alcohol dehydrogenase [Erwinia sp. OLCASP19]PIJ84149.1 alcohol dehydrogenase [Erwinia sp. OLMTSP26]PIJ85848.1 alcohol dehydrogenase [Erwinia sp. OLMDSP33]
MTMRLKGIISLLSLAWLPLGAYAVDGSSAISKGQYLATAGDCVACHTAADGKPFAGGLKMSTPVGAIYSTNITPDKETGIGEYSYQEFATALRDGIAKDGHHLYPAMPYTSFAKINDEDMHALYDFFMQQVQPVKQANRDSDIPWPLNMRWPLGLWNRLFHDNDVFQPDANQSAEWNRGAYLIQGLEHCGTCHTPRGIAFEEKALDQNDSAYLTGGTLEGWHAPNLTGNMKDGLGRWKQEEIETFLKTGRTSNTMAFGSMTDVIEHSTQYLSDADLKAMAVYLKSLKPSDPAAKAPAQQDDTTAALVKGDVSQPGAQEYMDNCAACHRIDGKGYTNAFPALAHNSALMSDDPSSLISIVLKGGKAAVTQSAKSGMSMPDFGWRLNDQQVASLLTFVRNSWGNQASAVTADQVKEVRKASSTAEQKDVHHSDKR